MIRCLFHQHVAISRSSWKPLLFSTPLYSRLTKLSKACYADFSNFSFATVPASRMHSAVLANLDPTQAKLMSEECILVDEMDRVLDKATKQECHLMANINKGMLHRAFSVFLFNTNGELLLQQRSSKKITYPNHITNTCCSHPLFKEAELEESNAIGVRRAAQRKLQHELGIPPEQVPLEDIHYITRMHYKAGNVPLDGKWGEHEIDYVLFIKKNVDLNLNPNEVKSTMYLNCDGVKDLMKNFKDRGILLTPWFQLIVDNFLYQWWDNLQCLNTQYDHKTIYRLSKT
ncbi:isopentenyl-diphosphate Delta-isomerase 1 isoform X1 [Octopus sinensis]|uniref:isopentenyl-diphosphate Delta-isomerase n=2 Tax=Octopus sinensis TaxID=2607531 RepID=A0A6P7SV72_9MOLL|nr:isopentenyl-diphosphate Delta-isomerase 1 isoform X1 [Octopus sinensis]